MKHIKLRLYLNINDKVTATAYNEETDTTFILADYPNEETAGVLAPIRLAVKLKKPCNAFKRFALTEREEKLMDQIPSTGGMLRKLMGSDEIKTANKLVKIGLLYKGLSDDRQRTVTYFKH